MRNFFTQVAAVTRRDAAGYFRTPIAVTVGVLFLAMNGWQFWLVVNSLADPAQPALFGAVLETFFGASALFWGALFVLVASITMNTVAGERRSGSWELLTTSPAGNGAIVIGKWLACWLFYGAIWLPTLLFPLLLVALAPSSTVLDLGPIIAAYLAVLLLGTAFCSIGVGVSALTRQPMVAASSTFAGLLTWLFVGEVRHLPSMANQGWAADFLRVIDCRRFLADAARGELAITTGLFLIALSASALVAARAAASSGRFHRRAQRARWITFLLSVTLAGLVVAHATRRPLALDFSRQRRNILSEDSIRSLRLARGEVSVLVVRPTFASFDPVYDEALRILERMRAHVRLSIDTLDPTELGSRVEAIAREFSTQPEELRQGGLVLFRSGQRVRLVELLDMAEITADPTLGAGAISAFRAEETFARSITDVTSTRQVRVCTANAGNDFGQLLGSEFQTSDENNCDVFAVQGAQLPSHALAALRDHLRRGRGFLWLAPDVTSAAESEIAAIAASFGIQVTGTIANDPDNTLDTSLWMATESHGDHSIVAGFRGRRPTIWQAPRALAIAAPATALVSTSQAAGAIPVAAAAERKSDSARAVVIGSRRSMLTAPEGSANSLLLRRAVRWLARAELSLLVRDKAPNVVRLILSAGQLRSVFVGVVILIPGLFGAIAGLLFWRRRRRG